MVEKNEAKDIKIKNKRCLKEFIDSSSKLLSDNYYYLSQVQFIYFLIKDFCASIIKSFEANTNKILVETIKLKENQNAISECFSKKFAEFEKRVNQFFKNNEFLRVDNMRNINFNLQHFNNDNNLYQRNDSLNGNDSELPSKSQVYNSTYNNQNNDNPYPGF